MIDQKTAEKLKRSTRKFAKADEELRNAGKADDVTALAENYLKARASHQKLLDKVESA